MTSGFVKEGKKMADKRSKEREQNVQKKKRQMDGKEEREKSQL